jgi:RimJ/RimL family protein N-acetyltransferase
MQNIIETERLTARKFNIYDAAFILQLVNTPGWLEFIGDRKIRTQDQAIAYIEDGPLKSYRFNGYGLWLVQLKKPKTEIGMCGILKRESLDTPDIGFALLPEFTGKGYAFEIAEATAKYAKDILRIKSLSAITAPGNTQSIKVLEKIGMKYSKTFISAEKEELMLFSNQES